MTSFFDIDTINELVLQGHSYLSSIGIKIIDDKNYNGSSILEGHFYNFSELLDVIELRKDIETDDDQLQQLVLRLYGYVENECVYYNGLYYDIETNSITSASGGGGTSILPTRLLIPQGTSILHNIVMNTIYAKYGDEVRFTTKIPKPGDVTGLSLRTVTDIPIDYNYTTPFTGLLSVDVNLEDNGFGVSSTDTYLTISI